MNRTIKFRAWDGKQMFMPSELYGDITDEVILDLSGEIYYVSETSNGGYCPSTLETKRTTHVILMQLTGETDKNGKQIWEGDIVEYQYKKDTVTWETFRETVEWDEVKGNIGFSLHLSMAHYEVIGNIYENPELTP